MKAHWIMAAGISLVLAAGGCGPTDPIQIHVAPPNREYAYGENILITVTITNVSHKSVRILQPEFWPNPEDPRNSIEFSVQPETGPCLTRVSHTFTSKLFILTPTLVLSPSQALSFKVHMFSPSGGIWDESPEKPGGFSYTRGERGDPGYYFDTYLTTGVYRVKATYGVQRKHKKYFEASEREVKKQYDKIKASGQAIPPGFWQPPNYKDLWYGTMDSDEFVIRVTGDKK